MQNSPDTTRLEVQWPRCHPAAPATATGRGAASGRKVWLRAVSSPTAGIVSLACVSKARSSVFIIPANRDLHVDAAGGFRLSTISKPRGWPDVITVFLRSLTESWGGKIIAVIVSGYDGDGAAALRGIKEVGGITIAQKPSTAKQPDMPQSAIASGAVDFILSPEDIAVEIKRIAHAEV